MEQSTSITDQIRTLLEQGKTPRDVIVQGYAKSTVYAIAKKLKSKLELQPIGKLEDRIRCLESLVIQLYSAYQAQHKVKVTCPKCNTHDLTYFEATKENQIINGYRCKCGYRLEF